MADNSEVLIGYSAFDLHEECYEYNENACYVADSPQSLRMFLSGAMLEVNDYRIDPVKLSDILEDFGVSSGEYALEQEAFARFQQAAKTANVKYGFQKQEKWFDEQPDLYVVEVS